MMGEIFGYFLGVVFLLYGAWSYYSLYVEKCFLEGRVNLLEKNLTGNLSTHREVMDDWMTGDFVNVAVLRGDVKRLSLRGVSVKRLVVPTEEMKNRIRASILYFQRYFDGKFDGVPIVVNPRVSRWFVEGEK